MDLSYLQVVTVSGCSIAILSVYFYCKNKFSYWDRLGIKGPKPWPLVGTLLDSFLGNRLMVELDRVEKYGEVYGSFSGPVPVLVISDPEVLQQICIKDFDAFPNHTYANFTMSNKYSINFLVNLQDEHWKKVRAFMSPTFTSGKIKRMFEFLDGCSEDLIRCANEQLSASQDPGKVVINAKDLYNLYAMDAIATCCYGLKLERAGLKDLKTVAARNEFVEMAMKQFDISALRFIIALTFPTRLLEFIGFTVNPVETIAPLAERVQKLMNKRRDAAKKFDDYLQLLVDAKLGDEMELDEMDQAENHHAGLTHESLVRDQKRMVEEVQSDHKYPKITLTDAEILSNAIFLLMVGLETTGTLLTHCTCILAFHKEEQEKLHEEISTLADDKTKPNFSYEQLASSKYLDAVICETLRIFPPVVQIDRMSNRRYKIVKYNIELPPKSQVFLAYYAVQNNPKYWNEPEKFKPDRFLPENRDKIVPGTYCPFGIGPRHCIGMRFSLAEAKLALAKLIMNFRFEPAPGTSWPMLPARSIALNKVKNPNVTFVARR